MKPLPVKPGKVTFPTVLSVEFGSWPLEMVQPVFGQYPVALSPFDGGVSTVVDWLAELLAEFGSVAVPVTLALSDMVPAEDGAWTATVRVALEPAPRLGNVQVDLVAELLVQDHPVCVPLDGAWAILLPEDTVSTKVTVELAAE